MQYSSQTIYAAPTATEATPFVFSTGSRATISNPVSHPPMGPQRLASQPPSQTSQIPEILVSSPVSAKRSPSSHHRLSQSHTDYLLPQSVLFRALFPGSPHLHVITRTFQTMNEPTVDFDPPWTPFRWPSWRTPRILPNTNGLPTTLIPIPHPDSLIPLLHYLYFGDLNVLGSYIRFGVLPLRPTDWTQITQASRTAGPSSPSNANPAPSISTSNQQMLLSDHQKSPSLASQPIPSVDAPFGSTLRLGPFTARWQGVINNAEYLGLPVRIRAWIGALWKETWPNVVMPVFQEESSSLAFPALCPKPGSTDSSEDHSAGEGDDERVGGENYQNETLGPGWDGNSFKNPDSNTESQTHPHYSRQAFGVHK